MHLFFLTIVKNFLPFYPILMQLLLVFIDIVVISLLVILMLNALQPCMFDDFEIFALQIILFSFSFANLLQSILVGLILVTQVVWLNAQLHLLFGLTLIHARFNLLQLILDLSLLLALFSLANEHSTWGLGTFVIYTRARVCRRFAVWGAHRNSLSNLSCRVHVEIVTTL